MKDIFELLRQKEQQLRQLEKEVEALRIAAGLLRADGERAPAGRPASESRPAAPPAAPAAAPVPGAVAKRWP